MEVPNTDTQSGAVQRMSCCIENNFLRLATERDLKLSSVQVQPIDAPQGAEQSKEKELSSEFKSLLSPVGVRQVEMPRLGPSNSCQINP